MEIRRGTPGDLPFLEAMLFEAFFWDPALRRPDLAAFREGEEFRKLLAGWGRPGDLAVVAEDGATKLGAAWYRLWTDAHHSYGFVDARTPELALGVAAPARRRGVGRALLRALVTAARAEGHPALSLSVAPQNAARRLYESEGFRRVGASGTSWTLRRELGAADAS